MDNLGKAESTDKKDDLSILVVKEKSNISESPNNPILLKGSETKGSEPEVSLSFSYMYISRAEPRH